MLVVVLAFFFFFFFLLEGSNFPVTSSCPQRVNVNVQMSPWNLPSERKVTWISPLLAGEHCKETMPPPCLELRPSSTSLPWCLLSHKKKSQPIKIPKVTEKQVIPKLGGQKVFSWLIKSKGAVGWVRLQVGVLHPSWSPHSPAKSPGAQQAPGLTPGHCALMSCQCWCSLGSTFRVWQDQEPLSAAQRMCPNVTCQICDQTLPLLAAGRGFVTYEQSTLVFWL